MGKKAFIQTYGCQMNEYDSFRMMEILSSLGYEGTDTIADASLVLVNTCSVRHNPENKVYSFLGTLERLKQGHPALIVGVAGCVAQQSGEAILRRARVVDMVFGPDQMFRLPEILEAVRQGERVAWTEWQDVRGRVHNFIPREWIEHGHLDNGVAFIAISKGCSNGCAFCIVPQTRGREVSREPENILEEVRAIAAKGAKEIWLLGQNVNAYHAGDTRFIDLLDAVSGLGVPRIRFTSPHPRDWDNALSDLMAARPNICSYLHMPLQSGADRVLEKMNRRHTVAEYLEKIHYMQRVNPAIEISTDLIVGFPTETDAEFEATLRVMEEVRFGQVFSFKYSPRPGTRAAEWEDDVPRTVKEDRLARLIALQDCINAERMAGYVGTEQTVLIDGVHPKRKKVWSGRTDGYRPVSISGDGLAIGDIVPVRIVGVNGHWLTGERKA